MVWKAVLTQFFYIYGYGCGFLVFLFSLFHIVTMVGDFSWHRTVSLTHLDERKLPQSANLNGLEGSSQFFYIYGYGCGFLVFIFLFYIVTVVGGFS